MPSGRRAASTSSFRSGPGRPEQGDELLDDLGRLLLGRGVVGPGHRVVDEDDVGVRAVPDLAPAEPAHADDEHPRHRRRAGPGLEAPQAHVERHLQQRPGEVGERGAHLVERDDTGEVGDGDPEQLRAPDGAGREHRRGRVVLAPGGGPHPPLDLTSATRLDPAGVAEELDALGRGLEQVGGIPAPGQGVREVLGRLALVTQQPEVPVGRPQLVADPPEGEQPRIGVGLVGEPAEHDRQQLALDRRPTAQPVAQCLEVSERTPRVGVPEGRQPLTGRLRT